MEKKADSENVEHLEEYDEDTRAKEKRLVRKLDMSLMPVVWILYFFNYMDRNNIAYVSKSRGCKNWKLTAHRQAKLDSFENDLELVGSQFNVAVCFGLRIQFISRSPYPGLYPQCRICPVPVPSLTPYEPQLQLSNLDFHQT